MQKYRLKVAVLASGDTLFIGVDVAKVSSVMAVVVRRGDGTLEILERRQLENNRAAVDSQVKRWPAAQWVYEAGPTGYRLLFWLKELGAKAFMVAPSLVPVPSGERVKTNMRDAVKLATLAAGGQLKPIQELTAEGYADRTLARGRAQAVAARSDIARQMKSDLLFHGITFEEVFDVKEGEEVTEDITKKFLKALQEIKTAQPSLNSGDQFGSYTGMTPGEHSTGESTRRVRITRSGNARLRATLVEASWRLKRQDPWAKGVFDQVSKRHAGSDGAGKKAIVAVARQLAVAIHAMLRDSTGWMEHTTTKKKAA